MDTLDLVVTVGKTVVFFLAMVHAAPVMLWVERRGCALIQDRPGPNRVGPFGLLQPVADFLKMIMKEHAVPTNVNRMLYILGPFLTVIPAALTIAAIPFSSHLEIQGRIFPLQIAEIDVGIIYMLAIGSLGVYGILFGGWASNNKFSLMGAMRSASQIVSYELPLGLAAVASVMLFGTYSLREIALAQDGTTLFGFLPNWGVFYQPLGFIIFIVSAYAETNRLPFDLPETEAELVGGFHTEYGPLGFATYFLSEYMNMATMSALMATFYFGGWHLPYVSDATLVSWVGSQNIAALILLAVFFFKITVSMLVYVWVRWTLPRFRFDQLMDLAWKNLIPLALVNIIATALVIYVKEVVWK